MVMEQSQTREEEKEKKKYEIGNDYIKEDCVVPYLHILQDRNIKPPSKMKEKILFTIFKCGKSDI